MEVIEARRNHYDFSGPGISQFSVLDLDLFVMLSSTIPTTSVDRPVSDFSNCADLPLVCYRAPMPPTVQPYDLISRILIPNPRATSQKCSYTEDLCRRKTII